MTSYRTVLVAVAIAASLAWVTRCSAEEMDGVTVTLSVGIHRAILDHINDAPYSGNVVPPRTALSSATKLISVKHDHRECPDYPVCLALTAGSVGAFERPGDLDLNLTFVDQEEIDFWLTDTEELGAGPPTHPNVKVVKSITASQNEQYDGVATAGNKFSFVVTYDANEETWAHEFGHTCSLVHPTVEQCSYNIMNSNPLSQNPHNQLTEQDSYRMELALDDALLAESPYVWARTLDCDRATGVAGYEGMYAIADVSGVSITFFTLWEENTSSFEIRRISPEDGTVMYSVGTPTATPYDNLKKYSVTDQGGVSGAIYQVVEHQTNGYGDLFSGPITARSGALPLSWGTYNTDSLADLVSTYADEGVQITPDDCAVFAPEYAILCPDNLQASVENYASLWRARGVMAVVFPASFLSSCNATYQTIIRSFASRGTKYFLLIGDANDHEKWDNASLWTGWSGFYNGVHTPASQPEKDIIPTFYTNVAGSPSQAWTYWTPYFASDLPYSDTDSDSLPDVMVGRLPASSTADVDAYTAKLHTWFQSTGGSLGTTAGVFTYAVFHNGVPPWVTEIGRDSLLAALPLVVDRTEASYVSYETDILNRPSIPDSVGALFEDAVSGDADLVAINTNASDRYSYTCFMSYWRPLPRTIRPFISLALTCGTNNFDETEFRDRVGSYPNESYVPRRPLVETSLFSPDKGPIAQIGPTRASFVNANPLIGEEIVRLLYTPGSTLGKAFTMAQRACIVRYPAYRDLFKSYCLLGDPRLGPTTITGVAEAATPSVETLSPAYPNPFNPWTTLQVYLPKPERVSLTIYDVQGRLVRVLISNEIRSAGRFAVRWDGTDRAGHHVGSGVYYARLVGNQTKVTQTLVLLR